MDRERAQEDGSPAGPSVHFESKKKTCGRYLKPTGGAEGGERKQSEGNLQGCIKSKMEKHTFYIGGYSR